MKHPSERRISALQKTIKNFDPAGYRKAWHRAGNQLERSKRNDHKQTNGDRRG